MPTAPDPPRWGGLTTHHMKVLQQQLCFCRNRNSRFTHGNETGADGVYGRLIKAALDCVTKQRIDLRAEVEYSGELVPLSAFSSAHPGEEQAALGLWTAVPSQKALADVASTNPTVVGRFLRGQASRGPHWAGNAEAMLRYLLLGDPADAKGERLRVADEVIEYFFRTSNYFHTARRRFGEPCSRRELAGEIRWIARQQQLTRQPARLVWVSGGTVFTSEGTDDAVHDALRFALASGVRVEFVYPHAESPSPAARSTETLAQRTDGQGIDLHRHELDTATPQLWRFLCPALQFLQFHYSTERTHSDLFILRGHEDDGDRREVRGPIAWEANRTETEAFARWLADLDGRASAGGAS